MNPNNEHLIHARALLADIRAAPTVVLPRRLVLLEWLEAFLTRATAPKYELGENEASDLRALEHFLRKQKVPAAA